MPRSEDVTSRHTFCCPFIDRCDCRVKFRVFTSSAIVKLESQGEHTLTSHVVDNVTKFLTIPQTAAIEQMVATNPMASATNVRRGLDLLDDEASKVSPSKQRMVQRAVARARSRVLEPFTQGQKLDGEQGSLTRLSDKIFLRKLVTEHNAGGKHLELHQPVCLGYQYSDGVTFGAYATPYLMLNTCRAVNTEWPALYGFDSTFGFSNKKWDLLGMTVNSLRRRANPCVLAIANKESAIAYEKMWNSTEGGVFELVNNLKLCRQSKHCEMCDAVREQIEQQGMRDILTPPAKPKKDKEGRPVPFKFELPLDKPLCDNTTKFSKWIKKRKPKLADKILQCAAHLTGIAWNKRSHTRFFSEFATYKQFYKLIVRLLRCSSVALAYVLQRKVVEWLIARDEARAAEWFQDYWTGERGHYMLAHAGVGGTNNNCGTEGNWLGVKKAVCGTAGSTSGLAVRTVVPSLLRFLVDKSKETASFWRGYWREEREHDRARVSSAVYNFPTIPVPIKEDWVHLESLRPNILELCTLFASLETKQVWDAYMQEIADAASEDHLSDSPVHEQIRAMFLKKPNAKPPPRRQIMYIIMPSTKYLDAVDPRRDMSTEELRVAIKDNLDKFDRMLENPGDFEGAEPDMDAEEMIALHESFYLLQPLAERWGKFVNFKCMCPDFFSGGCCGHSTLMALLYDSSLRFPAEWSNQQLPSKKTSKKPSAWAELHEEEEEPSRKERWAPTCLGSDDMIVTRNLKVWRCYVLALPAFRLISA